MQAKYRELKNELRRRLHDPIPRTGQWLDSVLTGHFRYYGVPGNWHALVGFRVRVVWLWWRTLRRRSQKTKTNWHRMRRLAASWLPRVRIYHPYPQKRLLVDPRQEPSALVALAGICAGGAR